MTDTELMLKVDRTAIAPITDNEDAADRLHKAALIVKEARRIQSMMQELAMDFIDEHGPFEIGDARYYNGKVKTTKVREHLDIMAALIEAHGLSLPKICKYLASDAWKHGAVRELVGDEQFAELFEVTEQRDLKTGKPKRKAKVAAKRFLPEKTEGGAS